MGLRAIATSVPLAVASFLLTLPASADPVQVGTIAQPEGVGALNGISGDGRLIVGLSPPYRCPGFCPVPPPVLAPRYLARLWLDGSSEGVDLPFVEGDTRQSSNANGISRDGSTIVGNTALFTSFSDRPEFTSAVAWFDGGQTPVQLGRPEWSHGVAHKVSADGSVIGGTTTVAHQTDTALATLWFDRGRSALVLPLPQDPATVFGSDVTGISADGLTVIGVLKPVAAPETALVWTDHGQIVRRLDAPGGRPTRARVISDKGEVIGGWMDHETLGTRAVAWFDGALTATPLGPEVPRQSWVADVNGDGRVIVGNAIRPDGMMRAMVWQDRGRTETELATPADTSSKGNAVSDDGQVIVGEAEGRAMVWLGVNAMGLDLGTPAESLYSTAFNVSADGSVIFGYMLLPGYRSPTDAFFVFTLAEGLQDYAGLTASFRLADDTAVALAQAQQGMAGLLGAACAVAPGADGCFATSGAVSGSGADAGLGLGSQDLGSVTVSAGHRVAVGMTLGMTLSLGTADLSGSAFEADTSTGVAVWAEWEQAPDGGTGWSASAAAGFSVAGQTITRGAGLPRVAPASGTADLSVVGVTAGVGYRADAGGGLSLGPAAGLTWLGTRRDGYSESGSFFTGSYDPLDQDVTYATVGLGGMQDLGGGATLILDAGFEIDLDAQAATVGGTTNVPGMPGFSGTATLERNGLRPFLAATVARVLDERSSLQLGAGLATAIYGDKPEWGGNIGYTISF